MVNSRKVVALFLVSVFICGVILSLSSSQAQPRTSNSSLPSTAATASDYAHLTKVTRSISIGQYLLTNVYDTYTIRNDGLSALTSFEILTDSGYDSNLVYLGATGGSGETLPLSKSPVTTNGYVTYDLLLSEPIAPGDSQSITVSSCYYNLTSTSGDTSTQSCSFQFGIYPISRYSIDSFECDLNLPQTATSPKFTPQPPTTGTTSATWTQPNVPAFSSTTLTATFTYSDAPILQMNSIARRIIVDPWGMVKVQEDHVIYNTGQLPVTTFNFRIPLNATNFTITDAFEAVVGTSVSSTTNWDGKTVNVTVSLTTNRAPLLAGDTFRYTISYQLPFSMFASESWNNYYCFLQTFPTKMDFLIVSETTQIILNGGYSVTSVFPNPAFTLNEGMQTTLTFSDSMVSPLQQRVVQISYQVNVFWIIWRPLIFILMFFVASAAYVYARKGLRKVPTQGMADQINIPAKDLQQFVSLYEEKSALQQELDTLNEDVKMKKIPKKSYNKRVKDIQTKSKELDEDIKPLRKSLGESDERFRKIMEKLQFFEAERISVEDSLLALDARYRRGAIPSRSAFQKLYSDFTKRMQKMQRETDKLLSELKSYIY